MNKQLKTKDGRVTGRGIEWCTHTHNVIGGCYHECKWDMPDGEQAECYAGETAEGVARRAYPEGFEHHYWWPEKLKEPAKHTEPARVFIDSMSDLFGHWVPEKQIADVFQMCNEADWHTFLSLTKNPARLRDFPLPFPTNLHVGFSTPPDYMWRRKLTPEQKRRMLDTSLKVFDRLKASVRWASVEPLSWDVAPIFEAHRPLDWAVIGAASSGKTFYQPKNAHLDNLLRVFDAQRVPVFFKGNLARRPHREFLPGHVPTRWNEYELEVHHGA